MVRSDTSTGVVSGSNLYCRHQTKTRSGLSGVVIASFPGPTQLSIAFSMEKRERAWYLFSREWCQDRKDGRKSLIVHGCTGPRTAETANIAGNLPHVSSLWRAIVVYTECCSPLNNTRNAACSLWNFLPFLIMSCSCEKRYQALPAFPYCKRREAGWGLGTRLKCLSFANGCSLQMGPQRV